MVRPPRPESKARLQERPTIQGHGFTRYYPVRIPLPSRIHLVCRTRGRRWALGPLVRIRTECTIRRKRRSVNGSAQNIQMRTDITTPEHFSSLVWAKSTAVMSSGSGVSCAVCGGSVAFEQEVCSYPLALIPASMPCIFRSA